jgi:hypothetical protein
MADLDFDPYENGYPLAAGRTGRLVNLAGAACSVALILGLGVWGYKLAVRDVTGIPVFRAVEGPLRVAPADPGGQQASHQGLSVNAVAAAGTARPVPEALRLAPKPVDLAEEDVAGLADMPVADDMPAASPNLAAGAIAPVVAAIESPDEQDAVAAALAEALADDGAVPDAQPGDVLALNDVSAGGEGAMAVAAADPAPPVVRPRARPAGLGRTPSPAGAAVAAAPAPAEVDAASLPAGSNLVQMGAFDDAETARREWARLQGLFPDLLGGKSMVIQSAQSGGRTFFRLRAAGFDGAEAARGFCSELLKGNATCIPVVQR